jgi:DNA-binding transcriptional LysR family regulator
VLLRHLQYLVALARERHFARAARACSVTQPTLSAGVKQLEEEVGVLLVHRSQRFEGFTPEGERVLAWARRIVFECDALKQEASRLRGELHGEIRIGAVPTAIPLLPILLNAFTREHPEVTMSLRSCSSDEIQRGLDDHSMDAGVTYLDNEPLSQVRTRPLFKERYLLLLPMEHAVARATEVAWSDVPALRYCLLTRDMQNRRIIDEALASAGVAAQAIVETDSVASLVPLLNTGEWASIVPQSVMALLPVDGRLASLRLVSPEVEHELGLVVAARDPLTPLARALMELAESLMESPGQPQGRR